MVWFKCPGSHYIQSTDNSRRDIWCAFCKKIVMKTECGRYETTKAKHKIRKKKVEYVGNGVYLVPTRYPYQRSFLNYGFRLVLPQDVPAVN